MNRRVIGFFLVLLLLGAGAGSAWGTANADGAGAPLLPLGVLFGLNTVDELDRPAFAVLLPEIRDHDARLAPLAVVRAALAPSAVSFSGASTIPLTPCAVKLWTRSIWLFRSSSLSGPFHTISTSSSPIS